MQRRKIYRAGYSDGIHYACRFLADQGVAFADGPGTDVTHLLLPVPSFEKDGRIRGGGILEHILADLDPDITVIGGNLEHPALKEYKKLDLLQDGWYVARNGAITADCAIRVAGRYLPVVYTGCPVLIIGWGRIGKCLATQLKALGARVTVAARKERDRQMLAALGYGTADPDELGANLRKFRMIFNTAPAMVLAQEKTALCRPDCILIELASRPGIDSGNVIQALGLPGKMAPESSGELIAKTIIRLLEKEETK